ncbi:TPA: hypothetical protein ACXNQV_002164 [Stenotrophomonas maltophilia]
MRNQLDIFDHDPARLAKANRDAAEHALTDVQFSPKVRQERAAHYTAERRCALKLLQLSAVQPAPSNRGHYSKARNAR